MSTSNIFSNVFIYGNCTVQGTFTSLGGSAVSQWTTSGSVIYYSSGNVGVGLTNPSSILNVNVTGSTANIYNTTTGSAAALFIVNTADNRRAFVGMDGTGLFAFSAGALALGTDNTPIIFAPNYGSGEKMRITTTGLVGIGTTNPGSLLTVSGGVGIGSGYNAFTAPTGGLIVQGNVGIGTSNPGLNALQVSGNVVTSGFTSNATNTVFNFDTLTVPFVNATQVGVGTTVPDNTIDAVGSIVAAPVTFVGASNYGLFFRRGFSTSNFYNCSVMAYDHNGDTYPDGISINGYDGVSICTGSNTRQERIRILAGGNVGIGTTSPGYLLDVLGIVRAGNPVSASIYLTNSEVKWRGDGTAHFSIFNQNSTFQIRNTSANFEPGTAGSNLVTVTSTGNVGIGMTDPSNALDVSSSQASARMARFCNFKNDGGSQDVCFIHTDQSFNNAVWSGSALTVTTYPSNGTNNAGYIAKFGTSDSAGGSMDPKVVISAAYNKLGFVGIGTTNPNAKLSVAGDIFMGIDPGSYQKFMFNCGNNKGYIQGVYNGGSTNPDGLANSDIYISANYDQQTGARDGAALGIAQVHLVSGNGTDGKINFRTSTSGSGTLTSVPIRMTVTSSGVNYSSTYKYNIYYSPANWGYTTTTIGSGSVLWSFSYTLPQASYVIASITGHWQGPSAGSSAYIGVAVDGSHINNSGQYDSYTGGGSGNNGTGGYFHDYWYAGWQGYSHTAEVKLAAGSHTFGLWVYPFSSGNNSWNGGGISLIVIPINYL